MHSLFLIRRSNGGNKTKEKIDARYKEMWLLILCRKEN